MLHDWDIDALALAVLGEAGDDEDELEDLDELLMEKLDVDREQFAAVANALAPFTIPANVALSCETFQGFVKNGAFIAKMPVSPNA